jgi:N-acetylglucosaminyldiphosphoundecaprenol N-acetyl-beta-D-mannosaminyltransferase
MKTLNFLDYPITVNPLSLTIEENEKLVINTINQYSFCIAEEDSLFRKSLVTSDVLLADGEGIALACQYLTGQPVKKVAGAEIHDHLLASLNESHGRCFYVGSTEQTLKKIEDRLHREYPNIVANFYSPPFKADFDQDDIQKVVDIINEFEPSVVFIGLTAPKQEKLSYAIRHRVATNVICSIGAVFDFYAGTTNRPSKFWVDLKLEWFIRLVKEPKRMWRRYLYYGVIFIYLIIQKNELV